MGSVLVVSDWYNKIPKTGWLKQQKLICHISGGWKVQDEGASWFISWWGPSSWLLKWPSFHSVFTWHEEIKQFFVSLVIWALIPSWGLHSYDLLTCKSSTSKYHHIRDLGFTIWIFRAHKHSVCKTKLRTSLLKKNKNTAKSLAKKKKNCQNRGIQNSGN